MNELQSILARVREYAARGAPRPLLDEFVQEQTGGSLASVSALEREISGRAISPRNLARAAGMGATFGFLDELAGAGAAVVPGGRGYQEARDDVRANYNAFREAHPALNLTAEIGGGLLVPGLGAAGAAKGATVGGMALRGAAVGASAGALAGAGYSQDAAQLPQDIGVGAVGGAALGGGLTGAAGGLMRLRGRLGAPGRLQRAASEAGGPEALAAREGEMLAAGRGDDMMVADLHPRMRAEADFATQNNPAVHAAAEEALAARAAGTPQRLLNDVEDVLGELPDAAARREQLVEARRVIGSGPEGYAALDRATGLIEDARLDAFLQRPVVRRAFQNAKREGLVAGREELVPSFRILNSLRKQLRAQADAQWSAPSGNRELARALTDSADELTGILEERVPAFRPLQEQYRAASSAISALDAGLDAVKRESVRDLRRLLSRMSPEEQEQFRYAVASGLVDELTAVGTNRNAAARYLQASEDLEAKLRTVFRTEDAFERFMSRAKAEADMRRTMSVVGGSQTHQRGAAAGLDPLVEGAKAAADPRGITSRLLGGARDVLLRERNARSAAQMAPYLLTRGEGTDQLMQLLQEIQRRQQLGGWGQTMLPATVGLLSGRQ